MREMVPGRKKASAEGVEEGGCGAGVAEELSRRQRRPRGSAPTSAAPSVPGRR